MKGKVKSVISLVLTLAMMLSSMSVTSIPAKAEGESGGQTAYKIYPTPHSVVYQDGALTLTETVNAVFEEGIDDATKNRLTGVMDIKDITLTTSEQVAAGKVNILVGIAGSGGVADAYAKEHLSYASDLYTKVDAYLLSIEDNTITILGKDTDAAFYAISSLKVILEQSEGLDIRKLQIEDYAVGQYRGFIEGYYGMPWSVDDRISLMQFGGDFKMNIYIFAPKDDKYHNSHWRDMYPDEEIADIRKMVEAGTAAKCRFAWAIHPFMNQNNPITLSNYDESLKVIQNKFQQLYDAGVRQFVISADDATSSADLHVKLLNDMNKWVKAHEGTYNLVFVPMVYCTGAASWGGGYTLQGYYDILKRVDEDVEFMWTGEYVCHPATQYTFNHFKQVSGREPFMWLNWPVNDVNHKRLVMGPAEECILNKGVTGFQGIVTNPLEQGEASKTSLFAIADYGWNTADFDCETSWADSFQYIDAGAPESLHELCKHMTNPRPGGITGMAESKEIAPYINAFKAAYNAGTDLTETGTALAEQFQKIADAADDFQTNGSNENLKDEIEPWVNSLRAISQAGIGYVKAAMALREEDDNEAWANYCVAVNEYKISKNCEAQQLKGTIFAEAGAEVLMPFAAAMDNSLKKPMEELLQNTFGNSTAGGEGAAGEVTLIYEGLGGFYEGNAGNVTDGNDGTYAWFNEEAIANSYIGLDLGEKYRIDSVRILQGKDSSHGDIFTSAILEYSVDGENYTPIETIANTNDIQKDLSELAIVGRYIRIRTAAPTGKWYAIREFSVTTSPAESPVYTNAASLESMKAGITKNEASVIATEDPITLAPGEYIGMQLPRIREVTSITAAYAPKENLVLEHSVDAAQWTEVTEFVPPADLAYLRIRNKGTQSVTFTLSQLSLTNSDRDTSFLSTVEYEAGFEPAYSADNSLTTAYLAKAASGAGSLTWRISSPKQIGSVYVLTYPGVETDAVVEVQDHTGTWHNKGSVSRDLNIFTDLEQYESIKSVRISWTTASPRIQEMYTTPPRAFGVTLNKDSVMLGIDKKVTLKASVLVLDGEDATVTWSSDQPDIASVDDNGVVTGKAIGTARITASVANGKYTDFCDVVVAEQLTPQELTIKSASAGSEEIEQGSATEGSASLAIDGNENTKWHSLWDGDVMENLWISLDLGDVYDVTKLQYLPRQDASTNGTILGYQLFVSLDGKEWLQADEGTWTADKGWKESEIATAVPARYVKLAATDISADKEAKFASAAEIKLLGFEHDENIVDKRYAMAAGFESQITPQGKYTEDSYQSYMDAWDAVKAMVNNVVATQKQVDDAVTAYRRAIQDLKIKVTGISVTPSELTMEIGQTETLDVQVQPADASDKTVEFSSENPAIVSVDETGKMSAKAEGATVIKVKTADGAHEASCTVNVKKAGVRVTGVEISGAPQKPMLIGDTVKITAKVQPSNAENQKITWSSLNAGVAKIDQNGNLTAIGVGTAEITVTTEEGGFTKKFTVTVQEKEIPDVTYTVKFDANGGMQISTVITMKNGDKYGKLPETSRPGYTFLGWYLGEDKIVEGAVCSLKADATLTARWQLIPVPVLKVPDQVKGLKMTSSTNSTISISWKGAEGAESYILERYDTSSKKWKVVLDHIASAKATDKKLKAGQHYKYRVTAVNKAGKSTVSASIDTAAKPKSTKITKFSLIKGTRKANIKWKKVKADGYEIYVRIGKGKYKSHKKMKKVSYTLKLKAGKKTYVKIRPYVKVSGKFIKGSYSKPKSLTVK